MEKLENINDKKQIIEDFFKWLFDREDIELISETLSSLMNLIFAHLDLKNAKKDNYESISEYDKILQYFKFFLQFKKLYCIIKQIIR